MTAWAKAIWERWIPKAELIETFALAKRALANARSVWARVTGSSAPMTDG